MDLKDFDSSTWFSKVLRPHLLSVPFSVFLGCHGKEESIEKDAKAGRSSRTMPASSLLLTVSHVSLPLEP